MKVKLKGVHKINNEGNLKKKGLRYSLAFCDS